MSAPAVAERRTTAPTLVFDLVDRFLRDRGTAGPRPRLRGRVRYRIVAVEAGGVRTGLAAPLEMVMSRNASGYDLWFGAVTVDGASWRFRPLPPPAVVVEIDAEGYQRVEAVFGALPVPGRPQRFALDPGSTYEFPTTTAVPGAAGPTLLRGTLRRPDGTGLAGARVRADPTASGVPLPDPVYVTGDTGEWVLPFADAVATTGQAQVEITPTGGPPALVPEVRITRGDTATLRQAALAGSVRRASGAPLPGVVVTADVAPGSSTTSTADGLWALWLPIERFPPSGNPQPVSVTATAPQGVQVANGHVLPRGTVLITPFVFA